jgi:DNA helicase-2/ATP-dependent DNA helicase PcrA
MSELNLNEQQQRAVASRSPRILVSAVPGSGKTATLAARGRALIVEDGVAPERILMLTFTRKAAAEMRRRVRALVPDRDLSGLRVSTFHALCHTIIEESRADFTDRFGAPVYRPGITVIGEDEREELLEQIIQELNASKTVGIKAEVRRVLAGGKPDETQAKGRDAASVVARYRLRLQATNAIDVDALIPTVAEIWFTRPGVVERYRRRWQHVLVDEFQDTDARQQELLDVLDPASLFAVGDIDQAIYSFRGANPAGFLAFGRRPDVEHIPLGRNYRSLPGICRVASSLISHNRDRFATDIEPARPGSSSDPVAAVRRNASPQAEAAVIAEEIRLAGAPEKFAVLARTNAALEFVERELLAAGVPVVNPARRAKAWQTPAARWLINLLRVYAHPADDRALLALLRWPVVLATPTEMATWAVEQHRTKAPLASTILAAAGEHQVAAALRSIAALRPTEGEEESRVAPSVLTRLLLRLFPMEVAAEVQHATGILERWETDEEDPTVAALLSWYGTRQIVDDLPDARIEPAVTVATIHGAKGLEWERVYFVGLEEGTCPSTWAAKTDEQLAEERNIAYVGVTRARDRLDLSWCHSRASYGKAKEQTPSRFLEEMEEWSPPVQPADPTELPFTEPETREEVSA